MTLTTTLYREAATVIELQLNIFRKSHIRHGITNLVVLSVVNAWHGYCVATASELLTTS